jgi:hypothetical protein
MIIMMYKNLRFFGLLLLFLPVLSLSGAEITLPRMELASRGASEDGEFAISTNAAVDVALTGGYKYGVLLGLSFESPNLGKAFTYRNFEAGLLAPGSSVTPEQYNQLADRLNNGAALSFRVAKATARDLFNLPLEFSYFVGLSDSFCSGEEFSARYGLPRIETDFTGFYYFPGGIGGNPYRRYNGIHAVQGTGLSFALTPWERVTPMLYLYQNIPFFDSFGAVPEKTHFSGDLRFLFNWERVKVEVFSGVSGGKDENAGFRGGFLAYFISDRGADFLIQCGIPGLAQGDEISIDNMYFLLEPRLTFGFTAVHVGFFYHPLEYLHIKTEDERGRADINIKFLVGDPLIFPVQGGLETTLGLKVYDQEDFSFKISPFVSFISQGLQWDVKLRVNPLAWEKPEEIFEIFMGIRTAY